MNTIIRKDYLISSIVKKMRMSALPFLLLCCILLSLGNIARGQEEPKKVFIHYMGWYGEGENGRHWQYGHAHTPLIGAYNSLSWATQMYHALLSWSCGIDGIIINVKDDYDNECLYKLAETIKKIRQIDSLHFRYSLAISFDDQGMNNLTTTQSKFLDFKENILVDNSLNYLEYEGVPAIFVFNYPDQYLGPAEYNSALNSVFSSDGPKLIWNQIDESALGYANSFYPWVGPDAAGWDKTNGSNWGKAYLQWFYSTINNYKTQLDFACGGVWPGFDDRPNTAWGGNRWMERKDGEIYNGTWNLANGYSGTLPLKWIIIETWNDWNEGTEIEPSVEDGYKYLQLTHNNINTFKGTNTALDTSVFSATQMIYQAANEIEDKSVDSSSYNKVLESAIYSFITGKYSEAKASADTIIKHIPISVLRLRKHRVPEISLNATPNPANGYIYFNIHSEERLRAQLNILDISGRKLATLYSGLLPVGDKKIVWNTSKLKQGLYFGVLTTNKGEISNKIGIK